MEPSSSLSYVLAFIQPFRLDAVVDALRLLPGFPGMSVCDVRGLGAHRAHPPVRGEDTEVHPFEKKVRIEIFYEEVGRSPRSARPTLGNGARIGSWHTDCFFLPGCLPPKQLGARLAGPGRRREKAADVGGETKR